MILCNFLNITTSYDQNRAILLQYIEGMKIETESESDFQLVQYNRGRLVTISWKMVSVQNMVKSHNLKTSFKQNLA